jgi:hypothetical protein
MNTLFHICARDMLKMVDNLTIPLASLFHRNRGPSRVFERMPAFQLAVPPKILRRLQLSTSSFDRLSATSQT